jgi:acetyltransferase-like isoleucine patch superfamily enzyme
MRKIISKILIKLIGRENLVDAINVDELNLKLNKVKINKCDKQVVKNKDSRFYENSEVFNFLNDRSKIKIGKNTHVRGELMVLGYGGCIVIGNDCFLGEGSKVWSGELINIGNNVLISHNVSIVDTNAHELNHIERTERYKDLILNGQWKTKGSIITKPVLIKDYAWISFGATILKGVTIGKGSIVAANSVVTKDVPDFTMVAGNPAKFTKKLKHD